jgi:hypothetical protein
MLITRKNVVDYLEKGLVKTSMVYPITKDAHYIVEEELTIKLSDEEIIKIPKGFIFNGSSSPRFLWWLFPSYGDFFFAAIIHDYLYSIRFKSNEINIKLAKKFADKEMLIWSNIINKRNFGKKIDNYLRYYAVLLFGMKQYLD